MRAYYGYLALMELDTTILMPIFINSARRKRLSLLSRVQIRRLRSDAVLCGLKAEAAGAAKVYLDPGKEPLKIINEELVPALDVVGKGFEEGNGFSA